MKERIVNVFTYGDSEHIHSIGWRAYSIEGTYQELTTFLRSKVDTDFRIATRTTLREGRSRSVFDLAVRLGFLDEILPTVAETIGDSVYRITHVVNGEPRADEVAHAPPDDVVPDYLRIYSTGAGFDFGQMIDDDFMDAMTILWKNRKYISALKLLVTMIDTLGFAEFGPVEGCFGRWLDAYCDLDSLGVSSQELWELRNSLLHMTNLDSRRVHRGQTKRLLPVITAQENDIPVEMEGFKNLHVSRLFASVVPRGIANWVRTFHENPGKVLDFIQRYDTVVSDS